MEDKPDPKHVRIGNRVEVESVNESQYSQQDERVDSQEGEQVKVERKEEGIAVAEEAEQEEARLKVAEEEAVSVELEQIARNTDRDKFKEELSDESEELRELGDKKSRGIFGRRVSLPK